MLNRLFVPRRRFVLIIGNAGSTLAYVVNGRVQETWTIDDMRDESMATLARAFESHRRVPVTVLFDVVEQTYRREAIPPVNVIDRPKVLRRRLTIAFPSFEIKAALPLGEQTGARGDLVYLFAALPSSDELERWIAFIHDLPNRVETLSLLPVESSGLAMVLARAVAGDEREPSEWTLLISRERTGGFRQIVLRRGKLAMTRLTPDPVESGAPDETAEAIAQEMTATLSYVTRLGYTSNAGLDVIVIGDPAMREWIAEQDLPLRHIEVLTPGDAGALLRLGVDDDVSGPFGDLLHAAWAGSRFRPELQMSSVALGRRQVQFVAAQHWVTGALAAAALALAAYCGVLAFDIVELEQDVAVAETVRSSLLRQLDEVKAKIAEFPERPAQVAKALDIHGRLEAGTAAPLAAIRGVGEALGPELRLQTLVWETERTAVVTDSRRNRGQRTAEAEAPTSEMSLTVNLTAFDEAEVAISKTNALADRLAQRFPDDEVAIARQPIDILPTQTLVGTSTEVGPSRAEGEWSALIRVTGALR